MFCRVRPALSSEVTAVGCELASIAFPDGKEHRQITLNSSTESATGLERKEQWDFSFDRVGQTFVHIKRGLC